MLTFEMPPPGHHEINPRPDSARNDSSSMENDPTGRKTVLRGIARVETLIQIALALPVSVVLGWAIGDFLDHKLHQSWIAIFGLLIGAAAGFIQAIRLASQANRSGD